MAWLPGLGSLVSDRLNTSRRRLGRGHRKPVDIQTRRLLGRLLQDDSDSQIAITVGAPRLRDGRSWGRSRRSLTREAAVPAGCSSLRHFAGPWWECADTSGAGGGRELPDQPLRCPTLRPPVGIALVPADRADARGDQLLNVRLQAERPHRGEGSDPHSGKDLVLSMSGAGDG